MKRLIPILLTCALALGLAGCGDFAPDPTQTPDAAADYTISIEMAQGGEYRGTLWALLVNSLDTSQSMEVNAVFHFTTSMS